MCPGASGVKTMVACAAWQVYVVRNSDSPDSARPSILPSPPRPLVSIWMPSLIQAIPPDSV